MSVFCHIAISFFDLIHSSFQPAEVVVAHPSPQLSHFAFCFLKRSPVFQTAYMPIKGKLFCFWCNFFVVFRFFLYVGLVKQLGDLKRKKTFLSLAKKRKCGFHPFFFEDLFNSLYEDTHFFSLRLSYLFKTLVVGWEISVKHKFCTYKESLRNFRDLLFRG